MAAQVLYRNAFWLVVPIVLLVLFSSPPSSFGFILIPIFFVFRRVALGSWLPQTRVNLFILILLTLTAVGFAISPARDLAVLTAAQVIASVTIFFFLVDRAESSSDLVQIAGGLVFLGFLLALVVPLITEPSLEPLLGSLAFRISAMVPKVAKLSNQNIVAGGLAIIAPVALALIAQKDQWWWRVLGVVSFPVMGFAILYLESRGALFALVVGIAVWLILYYRWILPLVPLAVIALLLWNQARQGPSVGQVLYGSIGSSKSGTFIERAAIWAQAAYLIRESPVVGIGLGAFPRIAPYAFPNSPQQPGAAPNHAHNIFLQVALDTGVFGAVAFMTLLFFGIHSAWRAFRGRIDRDLAIGLIAAFVVLVVHGLGDTVVWGTAKTGLVMWVLLGLAISFDKVAKVV